MTTYDSTRLWVKEKKQMALVFITITMILQLQMKECVGCLENERTGLLQLKSYLNSLLSHEEESFLKSWSDDDPKSDCCHWERVNCSDAIGGHIISLSLDHILPGEGTPRPLNLSLLHSFPQLKTLNFSLNQFSHLFDHIHGYKSFQRLEKLRTLDFTDNRLNNSVIPFLSAARSLMTLNLGRNELKGVFPPNELANLTDLRVLTLPRNRFSFFSNQGFINLRKLELLDISANAIDDFEGGDELRTMKLNTLDISYNKFSETARLKGLEHLLELKVLRLRGTSFNHTRCIQVLKDMPNLQQLDLEDNQFTDLNSLGLLFPSSLQVLNLNSNQLSSTKEGYSKICRLMYLRELGLRSNALTTLPSCLGNLRRLRTLDLSSNLLNGNLSSFVSDLPSSLGYLSLLENNFNGSFWFSLLVKQKRLTVFKLSSNIGWIEAQAESSWVPLFQLKVLRLHNVILGSTVPGFLVHQHDLCLIDISYSQLTGAFPTWLVQNNTRLQTLLLNNNLLRKLQLPRLVHGLQVLDISSNSIHDTIQEDIGIVFPYLRYMNFASNHFYGTIPSSMGEMKSLETLDISSNDLSGQLPKTVLSSCNSLSFLRLSNNQLQGQIFPEYANLTGLKSLFLGGNNFSGSLGEGLLNSKALRSLDISNNSISGTVPLWIRRLSVLSYLSMKGNQLKGPFPRQPLQLTVLDISDNSFSGSIPRNGYFQSLVVLKLRSNEFTGTIPGTLFEAEKLEVLDLGNNNFSGMILDTTGKASSLGVLLLRNNSFQSHIPEKICQLRNVGILDLSHNKFTGAIPSCFGNMSFDGRRYSDSTELRGDILYVIKATCKYKSSIIDLDDDLEMAAKLLASTTADFHTKSRDEEYQGNAILGMYGLDLSSNELSGEIPAEIGDLKDIKSLNFSRNRLIGSIPDSISKLEDLENLDLSNNKLHGKIPPQLADLHSLGYFNVSCNNLSGEIPFKGHLVTFDEKSYIGNDHLCGRPTNKSCYPEPSAPKQAKEEEDEGDTDDVIDMVWFYWTCAPVYICTCLALFVFLCIDSSWSREWFYRIDLCVHHLQRLKARFVCN